MVQCGTASWPTGPIVAVYVCVGLCVQVGMGVHVCWRAGVRTRLRRSACTWLVWGDAVPEGGACVQAWFDVSPGPVHAHRCVRRGVAALKKIKPPLPGSNPFGGLT